MQFARFSDRSMSKCCVPSLRVGLSHFSWARNAHTACSLGDANRSGEIRVSVIGKKANTTSLENLAVRIFQSRVAHRLRADRGRDCFKAIPQNWLKLPPHRKSQAGIRRIGFMEFRNKASRIRLFDLQTPQMRAFHMTWVAFFFCFFAWFGISPLMHIVRKEFQLTPIQIGWCLIAASASTIFARSADRLALRPRRTAVVLYLAARAGLVGSDGNRTIARLCLLSILQAADRRNRGLVRDYAVPHVDHVRFQLRGHGQRHDRRLGKPGRRRNPHAHAGSVRTAGRTFGPQPADGLAGCDVRGRFALPPDGNCLLPADARRP